MAIFKDTTIGVDTAIQKTFYPGMESEADGIDLRIEMNRILYGSEFKRPLGHWVVVRVFDPASKSKYFNVYSREGILGPSHDYIDFLVRSRRVPTSKGNQIDILKAADIVGDGFVYYLEWTIPVNAGSQIYEIDAKDHKYKPTTYKLIEKYNVVKILPYRLENGNVQYISAVVESDNITY